MKNSRIALRVSRRALAAVSIGEDEMTFHDGRHLSSQADRARRALERYLTRILDMTKAQIVVIDAPVKDGSGTTGLLDMTRSLLADRGIQIDTVSLSDVLSSFGLPGLRTRTELRQVVEPFWSELTSMQGKVKPYVVEAAAVAFYADIRDGLGVPGPT